jgi:hypothetical protein
MTFGFDRPRRTQQRTAAAPRAPRAIDFEDVDKARLASAFRAWASAANKCPVCVVQAGHAQALALSLDPDDATLANRLALEYLRRCELQDCIALVCDGVDAGTTAFAVSELQTYGFDPEALVSEDTASPSAESLNS